jgi:GYF domain 2
MNISISRDGVEIGEWTEEKVHSLFKEGQLLPTDYYWRVGMTEWAELSKMIPPSPPAVVSRPVIRTQVITVAEKKFVQKAMPVPRVSVEKQLGTSPDVPINVDKKPSWSAKFLGKLFHKRD